MNYLYFTLGVSVLGLVATWALTRLVQRQPEGTPEMMVVADAIKTGANAFMKRLFSTISYIAVAVAILIVLAYGISGQWTKGWETMIAFVIGAVLSGVAGYMGMFVSVRTNSKVAAAANRKSLRDAMNVALRGGAVEGTLVSSLTLLGLSALVFVYHQFLNYDFRQIPGVIIGFGFGASLVALFAQLGGGIFTKAADVGADLVGKVEAGIPEDDPRNPAVIADLVGDNVGDCEARGADIFESTAAENIGAMILGVALYPAFGIQGIFFPLVIQAFGMIVSLIAVFTVRVRDNEDPMNALNRGFYLSSALGAIAFLFVSQNMFGASWAWFFGAGMVGMAMSMAFLFITQYYTDHKYRPVREIAKASESGPATNIIAGLAVGYENVGIAVLTISAALWGSFTLGQNSGIEHGGIYGTAVATIGMLMTSLYILAMDTFGPITDNAGGIVEMSNSSEETRAITDKLDSVGNTTKALTKGYAVGSAALAAFLLFSAYLEEAKLTIVDLANIKVFIGAFIGAALVFVFSSLAMRAVGKSAGYIIEEVRRQFREKPGIMQGTDKPDYGRAVDITTQGALKNMVLPGVMAVAVPIAVGLVLRAEAAAGMLMVGTIAGVIMALVMNNAGGAWDNAKKYVESGEFKDSHGNVQGKKTPVHAAAVVGDTVGDPFKDTAGPSLHVLIKLLATLTLVLAALFV
jgi:K(+)-stimulated pyrophosphate-energized sodium pump